MNPVCEAILLRQFDPDCHQQLHLPDDVQAHLATCDNCRQEWNAGAQVDHRLKQLLPLMPPATVYRRSYVAAVEAQETSWMRLQLWKRLMVSVLLGLATATGVQVLGEFQQIALIGIPLFLTTTATLFLLGQYLEQPESV
jgi:hypothetical protein